MPRVATKNRYPRFFKPQEENQKEIFRCELYISFKMPKPEGKSGAYPVVIIQGHQSRLLQDGFEQSHVKTIRLQIFKSMRMSKSVLGADF